MLDQSIHEQLQMHFGAQRKLIEAVQSRAEVDSGRLSHYAWLGNSKVDEMARSGRDSICGGSR